MTNNRLLTRSLSLSLLALLGACDPGTDTDLDTPRGALLYDLDEAEVEQIHASYSSEDLELFRERLTAPFDCSLYGQFCDQVGPDAAYTITGEMIDFALDGVPAEDIQAHLDARIDEAIAAADAAEDQGEETFRASGNWTTQTKGNHRLRVRNGITTPVFGDRQAWTEAKTQVGTLGIWTSRKAAQLCVNTGTNSQWRYDYQVPFGNNLTLLESINPSNACTSSVSSRIAKTYHDRNNPGSLQDFLDDPHYFILEAKGCASASLNGLNFKTCAGAFSQEYH